VTARAIEAAGIRLVFDRKGAAGILRQDAGPDLSGDAPALPRFRPMTRLGVPAFGGGTGCA
jgi:hypothetical protein